MIGWNNLAFKSESQNRCCQTQSRFRVTSQEILLLVVQLLLHWPAFLFMIALKHMLFFSDCNLADCTSQSQGCWQFSWLYYDLYPHLSVFFALQSLCADCGNCLQLGQMFEILQGCTG